MAFRGYDEGQDSKNKGKGNFLELVNLLSNVNVNVVFKEHMMKLEEDKTSKVSHLSKDIQNEFINVLSNHVKTKLVNEIKSANYFGYYV